MEDFITFEKINKFTTFQDVKNYLILAGYPVIETEPIEEITGKIKPVARTVKAKIPNYFNLTVLEKDRNIPLKATVYFTDYEIHLDYTFAEHRFCEGWQKYIAYCLHGKEQATYIKSIESQMIENLRQTDRFFMDEMSNDPQNDDVYAKRHDDIIRETIFSFDYLKKLEQEFGLLHEKAYNPFAHPYFCKKQPKPRLVDIVSAANEKKTNNGSSQIPQSRTKEVN